MRLIDADALIKTIKNERFSGWGNCLVEIDDAPTVDAVPVVRCGKCKWSRVQQDGNMVCIRIPLAVFTTMEERFCFDGERKEDE